jgi:hypothetical protein
MDVDNSGSMDVEQSNMSKRMATFINKIKDLDYQVGVISTDPKSSITNGDGKLLKYPDDSYLITSLLDPAIAQSYLGSTVEMKTNGGSKEQGIYTTYRAIERGVDTTTASPNRMLFRDGAAFSVVLISDEDESDDGTKNKPDNLISLVQTLWGAEKPFSFHSIITIPNDKRCLDGEGESYGHIYNSMSLKTGGIVGSVCESDYGTQLAKIGEGVKDLVKSVNLTCEPLDIDKDGKAEFEVVLESGKTPPAFTIAGMRVIFATELPVGNHQLHYFCPIP